MFSHLQKYLLDFFNLSRFNDGSSENVEILHKSALLHFLLLIGAVIQFFFLFVSIPKGFYLLTIFELVTLLLVFVLSSYLRKTANYFITASIYALCLGAFFQYLLFTGGIDQNGHVWSFLYPVGILFFFGHKKGLKISVFFLLLAVVNLSSISVYNEIQGGFKLRFAAVYVSLTMIVYVYELTKHKLHKTILKQYSELLEARKKAEKADNLKSEFLAQMSHEIRTPVNTILNYTSLLKAEFQTKLSGELNDCFNSISIASNRLIRTIDLILNLSSIESGSYSPYYENISLSSDVAQNVVEEFEYYAKLKNIDLLYISEIENEGKLSLDKYTITQALSNLVDNAIKYTPKGRIEIRLKKEAEKTIMEVCDTGIGISREYLPSLFDKFSQETQGYTRIYEGNGLGLALVKEYCKINKAGIDVKSEKGVGTTFTIIFNSKND